MKHTIIVAFLLLTSNLSHATEISSEISRIESEWANIYYDSSSAKQKAQFPVLLEETKALSQKHPNSVEAIIWQAIIIATNAAFESPFAALNSIKQAKSLLESAIKKDPYALDGAAFVTLGTLYYLTPGWPVAFGDDATAEKLLLKGLQINPNSIDANYFYADYLLSKDKVNEASSYFKRAINAPSRQNQLFADSQLKQEALIALKNTELRKVDTGKNKFFSLFTSAKSD